MFSPEYINPEFDDNSEEKLFEVTLSQIAEKFNVLVEDLRIMPSESDILDD